MPVIEQGYRLQLPQNQDNVNNALPLLKGYLMLNDPTKREIKFLRQQTMSTLQKLSDQLRHDHKSDEIFGRIFPH
ncbi:hypothetical protein O9993_15410 [Vibrio lentus]|nr:hypothetical protein [Vibrio lentus]